MAGAALLPAMLLLLAAPDTGKLRESVKADEARLRDSPDDADALKRLGMAYLSLEEPDKAVPPFRELVRRRPGPESTLLLVRALRLAGEAAEAKSLLDQAITQSPSDPALHVERALLARSLDEGVPCRSPPIKWRIRALFRSYRPIATLTVLLLSSC